MNLRTFVVVLFSLYYSTCFSQGTDLTFGGGIMNYQGDLQGARFTFKLAQKGYNLYLKHDNGNKIVTRWGITIGSVYGDDKFNSSPQKERNLNFRSNIFEIQAAWEYHFLNSAEHRISPYVFGGLAYFHFNPYTSDTIGRTVFLKPFSTEGEGLPQYPNRKTYNLNQIAIPFGAGIDYKINCMFSIGVEFTERKLFTDYLDDVSKGYIDYNTLLKERGPLAVKLAYRGPGPYPPDPNTAFHRGNPANKDWYYTGIINITYHFNNCNGGRKVTGNSYDCPINP